MTHDPTALILTALGSLLAGGGLTKFLLTNWFKSNEEKHKKAEKDRDDLREKSSIAFDKLTASLNKLVTSNAVMSTKLDQLNGIGKQVIILEQETSVLKKDLSAAHSKIRNLESA